MAESITQARELLALNIKLLRKRGRFSQEKLAEAANLSTQSISDIEGCRTWVSDKTLENLAKALTVDVFQLFMPPAGDAGDDSQAFLHNRLMNLRAAIREDIDNRLNQFYVSETSVSRKNGFA
ncbi:MAG: helix-turn-helix domain-containing protein [Treponema sp.]|nr:helix-turn-helix domain-containing protein [Treponema sp.]